MQFSVSKIQSLGHVEQTQSIDAHELLGPSTKTVLFNTPVTATVKAQNTEGEILVQGQVETIFTFPCARCLALFDQPYNNSFAQAYNPDRETIDVSGDLREAVLIDLPVKPLCANDCKGLCLQCGEDLNKKGCSCKPDVKKNSPQFKKLPL